MFLFKSAATCILSLIILLLFCTNDPGVNIVHKDLIFDSEKMNSEATVEQMYIATINVSSNKKFDSLSFRLCDSLSGWKLVENIFSWKPAIQDTGVHKIKIVVYSNFLLIDTISWVVKVRGYWPENCPVNTHKNDGVIESAQNLPKGFFVYNPYTKPGLYISPINNFNPELIPNTNSDRPGNISISDCGEWICYLDKSRNRICLIRLNGCGKTIVPVSGVVPGFPTVTGFYRSSPYGTEIFYLASPSQLRSLRVDLSSDPVFGEDRILAELNGNYQFNCDDFIGFSVVKDQVFAEIMPIVDSRVVFRTGFLTIPNGGRGIANEDNIFKWKDDLTLEAYGCGHTQTHDGLLCVANAGQFTGFPECTPYDHNGFYVSKFFRDSDDPISMQFDYLQKHAISINWCPPEYQGYTMRDVDFWGWYFGNNNEYIIGRQMGSLGQNGIWIVHWQSNTWYRLTPKEQNVLALLPAVYFYKGNDLLDNLTKCEDSTTESLVPYNPDLDWFNPQYRIIKPNGGEVFTVGQACTLKVSSRYPSHATIYISVDNGITMFTLPGLNNSINPYVDTLITFTIPDSIGRGSRKVSTVSDQCICYIVDYGNESYFDISDSTFSIKSRE